MLSSAVLISRKPMRSLVYICHMTCGITKYVCGLALHRIRGLHTIVGKKKVVVTQLIKVEPSRKFHRYRPMLYNEEYNVIIKEGRCTVTLRKVT